MTGEDVFALTVRLPGGPYGQLAGSAGGQGLTVEELASMLIIEALNAARPYTVTVLDLRTRVRETVSRHAALGAAVDALRVQLRDDRQAAQLRGLPSHEPRVEHDGRPVDTEAVQR